MTNELRLPSPEMRLQHAASFGRALVGTGDLDPVYVAIWGARLPEPQLCRLLLAYWCFYHLGAAAWLSEHGGNAYWHHMEVAAQNDTSAPVGGRWPRTAERRHFRGVKCVQAVRTLSVRDPVERVQALLNHSTEAEVMREVMEWPLFGPWIAFKAADMMERCCSATLRFSPDTVLMYDEPRRALDLMDPEQPARAYDRLLGVLEAQAAPPSFDRRCGPQEVETVLCKWKSHIGGHYWVGKDIHEVRHGLQGWGETAERLLANAPPLVVNGHATGEV